MSSDTDSEGIVQKEPVLVINAPGDSIAPSENQNGRHDPMEEDGLASEHGETDEELEHGRQSPPPPPGKTASRGQERGRENRPSPRGQERGRENQPSPRGQKRGRENPPSPRGRPDSRASRHEAVTRGREDGRENYSPAPRDIYYRGEARHRGQGSSRDVYSPSPRGRRRHRSYMSSSSEDEGWRTQKSKRHKGYTFDSSPSPRRDKKRAKKHSRSARSPSNEVCTSDTSTSDDSDYEHFRPRASARTRKWKLKGSQKGYAKEVFQRYFREDELEHMLRHYPTPSHTFLKPEDLDKSLAKGLPDKMGSKPAASVLQRDAIHKKHQLKVLRVMGPLGKLWSKLEEARKSKHDTKLDLNQALDLTEKAIMLMGQSNVAIRQAGRGDQCYH